MADVRYDRDYRALLEAPNRLAAIHDASDEAVIRALAGASVASDPLMANVLADEAMGRMRRVRAVAATLPEGVVVLDAEARISYLNDGAMQLFGVGRADAIGRWPMELVDRLDADGNVAPRERWTASQAIARGETLRDEAWFRRRSDGALFCAAMTLTPLVREGEVVGAVGLFTDTTLQKAEAAEDEGELKALAAVARHTPDMLTRSTADGRFFWVSPSSSAVLGIPAAELVGSSFEELAHPEDLGHVGEILRMAMEPDMPPLEIIFRARRRDGGYAWVHARLQAVLDAEGRVQELVASTRPLHPRAARR